MAGISYDPSDDLFGSDDPAFDAQLAAIDLPAAGPSRTNNSNTWRNKRRRVSNVGPSDLLDGQGDDSSDEDEEVDERYNEGDEYEAIGFGDFGRYMRNKRKKLHVQETALRERDPEKRPQIFKGLTIHASHLRFCFVVWNLTGIKQVNGHTDVPLAKLRKLIVLYGGTYMAYLDQKTSITHIIATQLTPKKREEFARYKIARPEWISESVVAGRLLRWSDFGLLTKAGAGVTDGIMGDAVAGLATTQRTLGSMNVRPSTSRTNGLEAKVRAANALPPIDESTPVTEPIERPTTPQKPRIPATGGTDPGTPGYLPSARSPARSSLLRDQTWIAEHTAVAPDFIEGYYKQSRLHHLSTWKAQLLKDIGELAGERRAERDQKDKGKQRLRKLKGDASDGRTIFHIDFDCFFTTASLLARPELKGKPVCVCHAKGSGKGGESSTSEIASCSYEARAFGVKNGMALGRARELCPGIQTVSYDFDLYSKISMQFYEIVLSHADEIQPTSVDECIIDVSSQCVPAIQVDSPSFAGEDTAVALAQKIRREILDATRCEVSIGISHNVLLARLATRRAKPNNAFHLLPSAVDEHLAGLDIEDLPGVGWHQRGKIELALKTTNVGDLKAMPLARVQDSLGENWGRTVHQYAKGVDARELKGPQQRKSVSAEINYGIRFAPGPQGLVDAERFIKGLGIEVERRLKHLHTKGRHLTLRIMRKAIDAGDETWKFLGHGECDTFTKVARIAGPRDVATDDGAIIGDQAWRLLLAMEIPPEEMRGCAIQIQMLESSEGGTGQALLPFKPRAQGEEAERAEPKEFAPKKRVAFADSTLDFEPAAPRQAPPVAATQIVVPPMSQLDVQVIESLPGPLQAQVKAAMSTAAQDPKAGPSRPATRSATLALPSASQLDPAVLQELPPDVRAELEAAYRKVEEPSPPTPPPRVEPKPSPKKKRPATIIAHFGAAKRGGTRSSGKRNKAVALDPKQLVIAEGSQALKVAVRVQPVQARQITLKLDPSRLTDAELESLDIDPSFFREVRDRALQHEILSRRHAERPDLFRRLLGHGEPAEAKLNGVVSLLPLQVKTVPPPVIQGRASTGEVCALVEQWVEGYTDEAPDRRDVDRVSTFLVDCVDRTRGSGQDLGKAVEIVDWWALAVDMRGEEMTPSARKAWQGALEDVKRKLNTIAFADHGAALFV